MVEFFCELVPVHVKDAIFIALVVSILHPLLLFRVNLVPNRILVVPGELRLRSAPRVANLQQPHRLPIL